MQQLHVHCFSWLPLLAGCHSFALQDMLYLSR